MAGRRTTVAEPVFDPRYWSDRLARAVAREQAHLAVYEGPVEKFNEGRRRQESLLKQHVNKYTNVLDVGCGWGRLLGIMPQEWEGKYLGVDVCPEFIELARRAWPGRRFWCCDFRDPILTQFVVAQGKIHNYGRFDLAVCCSIKPMVVRNAGRETWDQVEANIRAVADKILLLGYDDLDDEEGLV